MNDRDTLANSEAPKRWRFSPIAILLFVIILAGACVSAGYTRTVSNLLREEREFAEVFGDMTIKDPSRVAIIAVSPNATDLPPWVDPENVSIFRVYIPANYGPVLRTNSELIAADSPLHKGGTRSFSDVREPEAVEIKIVISTNFEDGRIKGSLMTDSISSPLSSTKMQAKSTDDLVLDTVVKPGQPMRTFAADEAICILRLRDKEPDIKTINQTKLYSGWAIYLHGETQSDAFDRLADGESSSIKKSKP